MRSSARWDEAEYAIELVFDRLPITISWQMENEMECLNVRSQDVGGVIAHYSKIIDMSSHPGWEACVGEELISIRISQHRPVSIDCLWARWFLFSETMLRSQWRWVSLSMICHLISLIHLWSCSGKKLRKATG